METFEVGAQVRLLCDIVNDGTVFGRRRGELLMREGSVGFIKNRGEFFGRAVYEVHFLEQDVVIGCRAHELARETASWESQLFSEGESIEAAMTLSLKGEIITQAGTAGKVISVIKDKNSGDLFEVKFASSPLYIVVGGGQIAKAGGINGNGD